MSCGQAAGARGVGRNEHEPSGSTEATVEPARALSPAKRFLLAAPHLPAHPSTRSSAQPSDGDSPIPPPHFISALPCRAQRHRVLGGWERGVLGATLRSLLPSDRAPGDTAQPPETGGEFAVISVTRAPEGPDLVSTRRDFLRDSPGTAALTRQVAAGSNASGLEPESRSIRSPKSVLVDRRLAHDVHGSETRRAIAWKTRERSRERSVGRSRERYPERSSPLSPGPRKTRR